MEKVAPACEKVGVIIESITVGQTETNKDLEKLADADRRARAGAASTRREEQAAGRAVQAGAGAEGRPRRWPSSSAAGRRGQTEAGAGEDRRPQQHDEVEKAELESRAEGGRRRGWRRPGSGRGDADRRQGGGRRHHGQEQGGGGRPEDGGRRASRRRSSSPSTRC